MPFQPKFTITPAIASCLVKIERVRGFLEAAQISEDWITKMQQRALILEAHSTTHIEGTQLTLEQSERILAGQNVPEANLDDKKELLNYKKAFDFVASYINTGGEITEGMIREIHKLLVEDVRGNMALPGQYRNQQNYVVNSKTKEIIYTPPPAYEVPLMMKELINWIQQEKELPAVLVSGMAQFQFVHIHPFLDGNGRTGRLLSTLCLYKNGYDFKRLFTISEFYDRERSSYYKAIQSVRENDMDLTAWLEYFSYGLATQMQEIQEKGERTIKLDVLALKYKLSERQKNIINLLLNKGKISLQDLRSATEENPRNLQRDLQKLIQLGLINAEGKARQSRYSLAEK